MAKRKTSEKEVEPAPEAAAAQPGYTVLARRYRPQQFDDVIGQEPMAKALVNALKNNRVAHAYLFTGARGVGKTSTARILAKALNCEKGPSPTPCDVCDICRGITSGDDVDVLEIDGASNRGIDEVREIRQNVQYRPSRSRFKIYIIDEVHMLTQQAFNALLKTLEEPPPHVKFIFATTEAQRIPVTILSRCQRFDFASIGTPKIVDKLREIVAGEKMQAEDEALEMVARRAGGSMRDAQSLLDQLLAFGGEAQSGRLTVDQVHLLLGTAHLDRVIEIAGAVLDRQPQAALELLGKAADQGLQLGELLDQLIEYWRDLMIVKCAGIKGRDLSVPSRHHDALAKQAESLTLDSVLAGLDILATAKSRMRVSSHGRVLLEMALVRLGRLEDLMPLSQMAQWLAGAGNAAPAPRPTPAKRPDSPAPASQMSAMRNTSPPETRERPRENSVSAPEANSATEELTEGSLHRIWQKVVPLVGPIMAAHFDKSAGIAISGPNALVLRFSSRYNQDREYLAEPARTTRIEEALRKLTGREWKFRVETVPGEEGGEANSAPSADPPITNYRKQRTDAGQEPLIKRAMDLLGARIVHVDSEFGAASSEAETVQAENVPVVEDVE